MNYLLIAFCCSWCGEKYDFVAIIPSFHSHDSASSISGRKQFEINVGKWICGIAVAFMSLRDLRKVFSLNNKVASFSSHHFPGRFSSRVAILNFAHFHCQVFVRRGRRQAEAKLCRFNADDDGKKSIDLMLFYLDLSTGYMLHFIILVIINYAAFFVVFRLCARATNAISFLKQKFDVSRVCWKLVGKYR